MQVLAPAQVFSDTLTSVALVVWGLVFVAALAALIKGADWVLESARKIGLAAGLSPFVVGVVIVGFGTSTPELASSLFGVFRGAVEIPIANAVGSNIANILLIVSAAALAARGALTITKDIIDLEIPLFLISMVYFYAIVYDGAVTFVEALFLLAGFAVYALYTFFHTEEAPKKVRRRLTRGTERPRVSLRDTLLLGIGFVLLILGAHYIVESVLQLSAGSGIPVGIITLLAVAVGTSLPELVVSIKAAFAKDYDLAIGNIFGSNIYNALVVVGIPALFSNLTIDGATATLALPVMLVTSVIFAISCLSRRIHTWEGFFFLLIYVFFTAKIFGVV